jgi:hypothetical protein
MHGRPNRLNAQGAKKIATAIADIAGSDPAENADTSEGELGLAEAVPGQ